MPRLPETLPRGTRVGWSGTAGAALGEREKQPDPMWQEEARDRAVCNSPMSVAQGAEEVALLVGHRLRGWGTLYFDGRRTEGLKFLSLPTPTGL